MRRALIALAVVFAVAFGFGALTTAPAEAGGGSPNCFYKCVCPGVPVFCCVTASGTSCKSVSNAPIQCPQVAC